MYYWFIILSQIRHVNMCIYYSIYTYSYCSSAKKLTSMIPIIIYTVIPKYAEFACPLAPFLGYPPGQGQTLQIESGALV